MSILQWKECFENRMVLIDKITGEKINVNTTQYATTDALDKALDDWRKEHPEYTAIRQYLDGDIYILDEETGDELWIERPEYLLQLAGFLNESWPLMMANHSEDRLPDGDERWKITITP